MKTDLELQLALAKMLPEKIEIYHQKHGLDPRTCFFWRDGQGRQIVDESWLHVCWLIEQGMNNNEADVYGLRISSIMTETETKNYQSVCDWHASWQQRARALIAVKGEN